MKHLAAYLLASLSGSTPSASDVSKILGAVGIEADSARLEKLISELEGKDLNALIAEGSKKLSSVPSAAAAPAAGGAAAAAGGAKEEKKEDKKKDEPEEEEDDDMGFGLFD